ncbi:MAG: SURF1 family protein [Bradyrhizobiaceae bacterium]|nr:MAG: SURF1 family protein [Bradyrhizobiaceae bacterium]
MLLALGVWQLERRIWKLDLIQRVDQRVRAEPVAAPGPESWQHINASDDAYRHVRVTGHFMPGHDTLVQAVTELGGGYWLLSPFQTTDGFRVLVNRGFVPPDRSQWQIDNATGPDIALTGLLRISEPGGGFLRHNDPASGRWYSRDVAAIAAARNIDGVAPYFIDADASAQGGFPAGGLTVIAFPNNHLVYALTWFSLAAMLAGWSFYALRQEYLLRLSRSAASAFKSRGVGS